MAHLIEGYRHALGGHFFRSLSADFLRESGDAVPALAESGMHERMRVVAERWVDFARILEEQSERETCDPGLFEEAGRQMAGLADLEESIFRALLDLARHDEIWAC